MTNDYQMPLFDRYDMYVELDRNLTRIRNSLRENWRHLSKMTEAAIVHEFWIEDMIYPLELNPEDATLVHVKGTLFEFAMPYQGDDALWHLYPVGVVHGVLGEVFRGKLLLQTHASSQDQADEIFGRRLREITDVIAQQNQRLETFEEAIPMLIRNEISKLHRWPPEPYVVLDQ